MKIIERNLQEIGKSLLVSLPKSWTRTFGLKKGSKIKIMTSEQGFLSIAPEFTIQEKPKETTIEHDEFFNRRFFRDYFHGNEKITIMFPKNLGKNERKKVYDFLKRFISVQIVEETQDRIIVKSFKIEELSIEECLKRLYHLSFGMLEELASSNNSIMLKEMRDNMTRFYYLLVMQIRRFFKEGKFTQENQIPILKSLDFRMVAEKMQRIAEICENFGKIKDKDVINIIKDLKEHYSKSFFYFLDSLFNKGPEVWKKSKDLEVSINRLQKKAEKSKDLALNNQARNLMQIFRYSKEISGLIR
jgi:phosphate uptake regulator